jgi:hypothetical protein
LYRIALTSTPATRHYPGHQPDEQRTSAWTPRPKRRPSPAAFLVLLGSWKVLGAVALLVPRRALLKEWAYAGAFFTYTGAIISHLTTGYDLGELPLLVALTALTVLSWALRPPSRRTHQLMAP